MLVEQTPVGEGYRSHIDLCSGELRDSMLADFDVTALPLAGGRRERSLGLGKRSR